MTSTAANERAGEAPMDRITFNPLQCGGKPCIRGMRIRVSDILAMLDFPDLESADISACLHFAARRADLDRLVA
jgi:uncharacterized protein (DUF433 family)